MLVGDSVVQVDRLTKTYGGVPAVDGVSFTVEEGEVLGLLGPNGAGKTTTLECLEGLRRPDGGTLRVMGIDPTRRPGRLRDLIGVQLQVSALPGTVSVEESLRFFSCYHRVAPPVELLERLGLGDRLRSRYQALSAGQQRRLTLALAVAHDPPVVFLDEPTAGLDVASRVELHRMVDELRRRGTTVILSTHDMAEAEKLADRVVIILRGRLVAEGTPQELTAAGRGLTRVSARTAGGSLLRGGPAFPGVAQRTVRGDYVVYFTSRVGPTVTAVLDYIESRGDEVVDMRVERPSLEERFLELTEDGDAR